MEEGAAEGLVEADLRSADMETGGGLAGAVMRETPDLASSGHCGTFQGQVAVDMRVVCPQDVKKMQTSKGGPLEEMVCEARM